MSEDRSILLVDDDESFRSLLGGMLSRQYRVFGVSDGIEAMKWLSRGVLPDVIITDLEMPNLDGIEFLAHLKASGCFNELPVVVLSGALHPDQMHQCRALGAIACISKPFNPDQVFATLHKILATSIPATG